MGLLARIFGKSDAVAIAPREHSILGPLIWDQDTEFWKATVVCEQGSQIAIYLWGDEVDGPSQTAVDLVLPQLNQLRQIVEATRDYLAGEFHQLAKRAVASSELQFLDLIAYAGGTPYLEARFEWPQHEDWLIHATLVDGKATSWGFDD